MKVMTNTICQEMESKPLSLHQGIGHGGRQDVASGNRGILGLLPLCWKGKDNVKHSQISNPDSGWKSLLYSKQRRMRKDNVES